jgi:sugar phosphate isomerase/epimerase
VSRLSLNLITVDQWSLEEAVAGCAAAGIEWIAPWRHQLDGRSAEAIREAGLRVSSLCRGGFFATAPPGDNERAVEEAAELGTDVLVLVCGPLLDRDLRTARATIARGIEALAPHAEAYGVRLGIEPLHPMLLSERSAIVTLGEALDLAERLDVGVIVDAYHVFWDPDVEEQIGRAGGRILGFHVSDWVTPAGDVVASRALMGDGLIDLARLQRAVEAAGYDGPIEVEVISEALRALPGEEVVRAVVERFAKMQS